MGFYLIEGVLPKIDAVFVVHQFGAHSECVIDANTSIQVWNGSRMTI
jgi:hypothetical protein